MIVIKPIDLIVANCMHSAVSTIDKAKQHAESIAKVTGGTCNPGVDLTNVNECVARHLLCTIAHEASLAFVFEALKACKAPDNLDLIGEGMQAVRDMQK